MVKTIKVIRLAPGESLLVLTESGPKPMPPSGAAAVPPYPFLSDPQDDDKIIALFRVA